MTRLNKYMAVVRESGGVGLESDWEEFGSDAEAIESARNFYNDKSTRFGIKGGKLELYKQTDDGQVEVPINS